MAEIFSKRVGRIVSASLNALIDAVEDSSPEMVMEQALRDLDGAVDEVLAEKGKATAAKYLANKRLLEQNNKHADFVAKIELAISQGRDDLAEAAIALQMDIEAQFPILEQTIADNIEKETEHDKYLNALSAKKREMLSEMKQWREAKNEAAKVSTNHANTTYDQNVGSSDKAKSAMAAFDRILEKQTGLGSLNADASNATKIAELEELARKNRIQQRLAAFKTNNNLS